MKHFQVLCNNEGGMLAEIHSQDEQDFLDSLLPRGHACKYIQNSNVAMASLHFDVLCYTAKSATYVYRM